MTGCMSVTLGYPSTPCTLAASPFHVKYPGPVVGFIYQGFMVPAWAEPHLPSVALTPVRMGDIEESIRRMPQQFASAASASCDDIVTALQRMRDRMLS